MAINRTGTNLVYGLNNPSQGLSPSLIFAQRDPESTDRASLGTMWINTDANAYFVLTSSNNWTAQATGSTSVATLDITGGSGTVLNVYPSGNTSLGGDLAVTGNTTLSGTLIAEDTVTINASLEVDTSSIISLSSTSNTDPAISITADGGPSEAINIISNQGTGSAGSGFPAVILGSVAGGISISAGKDIELASASTASTSTYINSSGGLRVRAADKIDMRSRLNDVQSTYIYAAGGTSETVEISSTLGTGTSSVNVNSLAGGITIDAGLDLSIDSGSTGATLANLNIGTATRTQTVNIGTNSITNKVLLQGGSASIDLNKNYTNGVHVVSGGVLDLLCDTLTGQIYLDPGSSGFIRFQTGDPTSSGNFQFYNNQATDSSFTITNNAYFGTCTITGQTLATGATQDIVINNSNITTSSGIIFSVSFIDTSAGGGLIDSVGSVQAAGSLTITVKNTGTGTIDTTDNIIVTFQIFL